MIVCRGRAVWWQWAFTTACLSRLGRVYVLVCSRALVWMVGFVGETMTIATSLSMKCAVVRIGRISSGLCILALFFLFLQARNITYRQTVNILRSCSTYFALVCTPLPHTLELCIGAYSFLL